MLVKNIISVIIFTNTILQHVNNMLNGPAVTKKFSLKIKQALKRINEQHKNEEYRSSENTTRLIKANLKD